mmetsp:Transcript_26699/g.37843  ORF Transcript_26699/g.37843 Transcript_26699/m.37843 type:complete len:548 (+) Transcript_26699:2141-3784(+)
MVLTNAQNTAFFTDPAQMGIPAATLAQVNTEGIITVDDLEDFDDDALKQLADNLRRPGGQVPVDPANPGAGMVATPAFVFGAKSQARLKVACRLVRYHVTVGRPTTAANMRWNHVGKNFKVQWDALMRRKEEDRPDTPTITKALPILKWIPAFEDHLSCCIGVRDIPLSYVIRADELVPAAAPALVNNQPHSEQHGSIIGEMVARASHDHAAFADDNEDVYYMVEEATRSTQYAASIRTFTRGKNGRGAMMALKAQFVGVDKWTVVIHENEALLHTRKWKGTGTFTLEHFIAQHCNAYVTITHAAEHVPYQLLNEATRVRYLLEGIKTQDAQLLTAIEAVRGDQTPTTGKANSFELAAAHLQPRCPVTRKQSIRKRPTSVADVHIDGVGARAPSIGKTGVHLRWHKYSEYQTLNPEQRSELYEWQQNNPDKVEASKAAATTPRQNGSGSEAPRKKQKRGNSNKKTMTKKSVAKLVAKQVEKALGKSSEEDKEEEALQEYFASMDNAAISSRKNTTASAAGEAAESGQPKPKSTLRSILKTARNSGRK